MTVDIIRTTARAAGLALSVSAPQHGPTVTTYGITPEPGASPRRVEALTETLGLALGRPVRFAGQRGTELVLEVPAEQRATVPLSHVTVLDGADGHELMVPVGITTDGLPLNVPLAQLPHLLVAGATGQGKSVYVNGVLVSLTAQAGPDRLRLALIDPKRVELARYADLPHLVAPVATDVDAALDLLTYAVEVMEQRYARMQDEGVTSAADLADPPPALVVVVDELADLMLTASGKKRAEPLIARLAGKARAAAVHLIVATQHPKREVLTGIIKANLPTRIAFKVGDRTASMVALDRTGAERLMGAGDGLVVLNGSTQAQRFQAAYVSSADVAAAVAAWESRPEPQAQAAPQPQEQPAPRPALPVVAPATLTATRPTHDVVLPPAAPAASPAARLVDELADEAQRDALGLARRVDELTELVAALAATVRAQGELLDALAGGAR